MSPLALKYLEINKHVYGSCKNPLRSHGPDHHVRVLENAMRLAGGQEVDMEVLTTACLLHDISAYFPDETGDRYHEEDPRRAEEILRENDFPVNKITNVVDAIRNHGSGVDFKTQRNSIESIILCDADKLDVFGPIGIARIIMVKTLKGGALGDVVDDFYTKGHLQRKWEAMSPRAQEIGKADYDYSMNFLKSLAQKLNMI